jgi:hypothetical protein
MLLTLKYQQCFFDSKRPIKSRYLFVRLKENKILAGQLGLEYFS